MKEGFTSYLLGQSGVDIFLHRTVFSDPQAGASEAFPEGAYSSPSGSCPSQLWFLMKKYDLPTLFSIELPPNFFSPLLCHILLSRLPCTKLPPSQPPPPPFSLYRKDFLPSWPQQFPLPSLDNGLRLVLVCPEVQFPHHPGMRLWSPLAFSPLILNELSPSPVRCRGQPEFPSRSFIRTAECSVPTPRHSSLSYSSRERTKLFDQLFP